MIPSKLQCYVLHWYRTYLLHPGMDRTEVMICQHLYWPDIRYVVRKEVTNCGICKRTKRSNKKYGKLPANLTEETLWDKLCVGLIWPYTILREVNKENLHLKDVTMIDSVIGWFEILQYENKRAISISNLVETTWISR